jgi:4-hydroxybenzoate-CoA ligase
MFKVSGIWVSPFEVESALITHPAVLEAAVVPEADPEGLLKPKAFVVLRAGSQTDDLYEVLKEHVKQKIGPWKYPRWIDVVESLPKTATGKIQRYKLREAKRSTDHESRSIRIPARRRGRSRISHDWPGAGCGADHRDAA